MTDYTLWEKNRMKTSMTRNIKFSETDDTSVLRIGKVIDFLQDCSNYQSELIGAGIEYQNSRNRAWILSSWQIEIRGQFRYGDDVIVSTWAYDFKGACGRRNFSIASAASPEENIILADSVWALFDTGKGMLTRVMEDDVKPYGCEAKLDMDYTRKKILRAQTYEEKEHFVVRKYQLDLNNHMNNAWYVKVAEEFIEDEKLVNSVRVEYRKSAKYSDILIPFVAKEEKRLVVELRSTEGELYAIVQFGLE